MLLDVQCCPGWIELPRFEPQWLGVHFLSNKHEACTCCLGKAQIHRPPPKSVACSSKAENPSAEPLEHVGLSQL